MGTAASRLPVTAAVLAALWSPSVLAADPARESHSAPDGRQFAKAEAKPYNDERTCRTVRRKFWLEGQGWVVKRTPACD